MTQAVESWPVLVRSTINGEPVDEHFAIFSLLPNGDVDSTRISSDAVQGLLTKCAARHGLPPVPEWGRAE